MKRAAWLLWLFLLAVLGGAWWLDRSFLALNLSNCRFVLEEQRQTIQTLKTERDELKAKFAEK